MSNSLAKIEHNPNYQELVRRRSSLGWMLSLIMLVVYFGFILLVAYAPRFLGIRIGTGVTTIGIPIGLAVILLAFVLTGIYVRRANSSYDVLVRKIVEEAGCAGENLAERLPRAPSKAEPSRLPTGRPSACSLHSCS